ncbi:AfsR/SARP family transcriptional regulator [Paractinoplanes maris]|uniref:AfsR/SARP family transcriptional regulator n=1 Tax=Paractinoplanes maris TaxID=1734446 RepID=UPI0020224AE0|nr:BTAD domain-containing putative transcriptional regulator [Actinoplanes maris]
MLCLPGLAADDSPPGLCLFGEPCVVAEGRRRPLPDGARRLVAFTALHGGRVERRHAAGVLWPVGDDLRAAGNLRSALWRLRASGVDVLDAGKRLIRIRDGVVTDLDLAAQWTAQVTAGVAMPPGTDEAYWRHCRGGLLPGWTEYWVGPHRERLRQRVLHAMESLTRRVLADGDPSRATALARQVCAVEPLRESTHRILADALRGCGRPAEARAADAAFRSATARRFGPGAGAAVRAALTET